MAIDFRSRHSSKRPPHGLAPWRWAAAGATAGVLAAMLGFAPARWAATWIQQATGGQVMLRSATGTIWQGSAQLTLAGGADSSATVALPGRLSWNLSPSWNGLTVQANAQCCMDTPVLASIRPGWGKWTLAVADHRSNWPTGLLAGLGTPWNTVQAEGQMVFSLQALSLEWLGWSGSRMTMSGRMQIDALDVTSRLSTIKPMGSYRLSVDGGGVNSMQLDTLQGSLLLTGSGKWVGGRLRFEGEARASPERQDALNNLLNIIGRRDGMRSIIKLG